MLWYTNREKEAELLLTPVRKAVFGLINLPCYFCGAFVVRGFCFFRTFFIFGGASHQH